MGIHMTDPPIAHFWLFRAGSTTTPNESEALHDAPFTSLADARQHAVTFGFSVAIFLTPIRGGGWRHVERIDQ